MNEQSQLNDLFRQLWRDIDNAVKTDDKHDYQGSGITSGPFLLIGVDHVFI